MNQFLIILIFQGLAACAGGGMDTYGDSKRDSYGNRNNATSASEAEETSEQGDEKPKGELEKAWLACLGDSSGEVTTITCTALSPDGKKISHERIQFEKPIVISSNGGLWDFGAYTLSKETDNSHFSLTVGSSIKQIGRIKAEVKIDGERSEFISPLLPENPKVQPYMIFVSQHRSTGALGSSDSIERACTQMAQYIWASFSGTASALLYKDSHSLDPILSPISGSIYNLYGEVVAEDGPELLAGNLKYAVSYSGVHAWIGSANKNCSEWSDASSQTTADTGDTAATGVQWVQSSSLTCDEKAYFYCLIQN